jgi:uncharacterized protein
MQFEEADNYILNRLANELPEHFYYHNLAHTRDVYAAVKQLAGLEKIDLYKTRLLLTAACYHDSGFLERIIGHEIASCKIAAQMLPGFDYSVDEIERICGIIMATRIPQQPQNKLEQILSDADLDYLGRDDFQPISQKLFAELSALGRVSSKEEWDHQQVEFIENHHYFTRSAITLRQAKKEENLKQIKAKL